MNTNRRSFLAKIFAGAIAAPAVTKLIAGGVSKSTVKPISGTQQVFLCDGNQMPGEAILGIAGESIQPGQIVYVWYLNR